MTYVYGEADEATLAQMERCMAAEEGAIGVLCADNHLGYSQPIGGAVAYRDHISPSGVGYDIGCGNKAVRTPLLASEIEVGPVMDEVARRVSFGIGRANYEPVDHPVLDEIAAADFAPQRRMVQAARSQLGTVGSGNHYVDLFADEEDRVWVGVHFGSRGFGHKTASGFLALAEGLQFTDRAADAPMHSPPVTFAIDSDLGQSYIEAMELAGRYAYAGRDVVVDKVLEILGTESVEEVHNHHNFAWREEHGGVDYWVVRKGCTPAFPGQRGFVGASMGEDSVILEGTESAEPGLFSTVHGAGRAMSRMKAAGKFRFRKRYACMDRDCSRLFEPNDVRVVDGVAEGGVCPDHPEARVKNVRVSEQVREGLIDFPTVQAELAAKGIELRGGAADEAPAAYKRLDEVLEAHGETIRVIHRLRPLGVAMAGAGTVDPYRD